MAHVGIRPGQGERVSPRDGSAALAKRSGQHTQALHGEHKECADYTAFGGQWPNDRTNTRTPTLNARSGSTSFLLRPRGHEWHLRRVGTGPREEGLQG